VANDFLMVVGSLNREAPYFQGARGVGLSVFGFDSANGTAALICEDGGVDNPTFLSVDPTRGCIYANTEVFGWHEGTVSAYRFDPATRRLRYLNKQPSLGSITAYSSLDRSGRHLLVANYGMGPNDEGPDRAVVVYPLREDGGLGGPSDSVAHRGKGPNAERQERAHPHCVLPTPDGRFVVVVDLGLDAILTYRFGPDGQLFGKPVTRSPLPSGAGPRHLAFHPTGRMAVVICELDSTLLSLRYGAETGGFTPVESIAAVPAAARSGNHCSDVQIHPNGRFVYGANRGHDSIVILTINPQTGRLSLVGHHPCGGRTPRSLAIDPTGRFLVVANQNSDTLSIFAIDDRNGALSVTARTIELGTPMCVKFMPSGTA
jgi:6-phosphogluconolactonase